MMNEAMWEAMVDEQAKAFAHLCSRDDRVDKLVKQYDAHGLDDKELDELIELMDDIYNNPFFIHSRMMDGEKLVW